MDELEDPFVGFPEPVEPGILERAIIEECKEHGWVVDIDERTDYHNITIKSGIPLIGRILPPTLKCFLSVKSPTYGFHVWRKSPFVTRETVRDYIAGLREKVKDYNTP